MILIQASKPATYQVDDQLMTVVFQQYLKSIRFNEPKTYRIEGVTVYTCLEPNLHMMNGTPPTLFLQNQSTIATTYKY